METFFIVLIILAQGYFFYLTLQKINLLKGAFKDKLYCKVLRVSLLQSDLESVAPVQLLARMGEYQARAAEQEAPVVSVALLQVHDTNPVGSTIVYSINTYLLRNSGAAPDFGLIKDIAERNSDAAESAVSSTLSIPLYLGLLGTLLGIVFGLSHISGLTIRDAADASGTMLDQAIPVLLGGVKVAMIASFSGLLLTILHSGIFYRQARAINAARKNEFFTFIQVELLPLLSANINTAIYSLQSNLVLFNRDFGQNIQRLDGLMRQNNDALKAQQGFMDTLSKIDIMEFAAANVKVLNGLKTAVRSFSDFNEYVGAVNTALQKTDDVIVHLDEVLEHGEHLDQVAHKLIDVFDQNKELMAFIRSHFAALDSSKQLIGGAVVDVNEFLSKAIDELKIFTEEKIAAIRALEIREASLMQDTYPEKWRNLDELKKMDRIAAALTEWKSRTESELNSIGGQLLQVKGAVEHLEGGITVKIKMPAIGRQLKQWFRKNRAYEKV